MQKTGVGIIGCGNISHIYLENMTKLYSNLEVIACADIFPEKAIEAKNKYGLKKAYSVEELLKDPDIRIVVNLTIPPVHYSVNKQILEAGKHAYCEKPMALSVQEAEEIVQLAKEKNLYICNAPDTFMGPGIQTVRRLIDDGEIGEVIGFTANLMTPGHDCWHPHPDFYYKTGGGPILDMGPYYLAALVSLLGPIEMISCYGKASFPERTAFADGHKITVDILTHYTGLVKLKNGAAGNINMSFDVWHSALPCMEIYGTEGMICVPDPNTFGGPVKMIKAKDIVDQLNACPHIEAKLETLYGGGLNCLAKEMELSYTPEVPATRNLRGLGVSEMADAIRQGRTPCANSDFACHVTEALCAFPLAAMEGKPYIMHTTCRRPAAYSGWSDSPV